MEKKNKKQKKLWEPRPQINDGDEKNSDLGKNLLIVGQLC